MSTATASIAYDGPALSEGLMDVRDLAPALLAAGELIDAANSALNGDTARVTVQVKATGAGSFEITLQVVQSLSDHLITLLTSREITAANRTWAAAALPSVIGGPR